MRASIVVIALFINLQAFGGSPQAPKTLHDYLQGLPFTMPEMSEPTFPDTRVSIVDHGAVPDGHTMNTQAFADAIAACASAGGGTVVVPPGTWLTGPIKLVSNVNLHVEKGALVQFSRNIRDFPFLPGFDGKSRNYVIAPPLYAYNAKNIAITGGGIFDGSGDVWRYEKKEKLTSQEWKKLVASGGVVSPDGKEWWPSREAMEGESTLRGMQHIGKPMSVADFEATREFLRPDLVHLVQCTGVLFDGPTFENSPKFHLHPVQCEDVIIRNVNVLSPWHGQNTDGIDPGSCRNVVIYNCTIDVGDDGICLKPSSIAKSQSPGPACENIVVADCVVHHAHGGFVIGSESFGGVRNVSVRNCVFAGTDVGLRFKSLRGKGGLVEKIYVDGIQMNEIATDAILFDMYYSGGSPDVEATKDLAVRKSEPVTSLTPQFQDFFVSNVVCNGADRAVVINGLPELPIKNMVLRNVSIASRRGVFIADADGVQLDSCRIVPETGPVVTVIDSRHVAVQGGSYPGPADVFMSVIGEPCSDIRIVGADISHAKKSVDLGPGVRADAVVEKP